MYCSHCGKELPANAKFCSECGMPFDRQPVPPRDDEDHIQPEVKDMPVQPEPVETAVCPPPNPSVKGKTRKRRPVKWIIGICAIVVLALGAILLVKNSGVFSGIVASPETRIDRYYAYQTGDNELMLLSELSENAEAIKLSDSFDSSGPWESRLIQVSEDGRYLYFIEKADGDLLCVGTLYQVDLDLLPRDQINAITKISSNVYYMYEIHPLKGGKVLYAKIIDESTRLYLFDGKDHIRISSGSSENYSLGSYAVFDEECVIYRELDNDSNLYSLYKCSLTEPSNSMRIVRGADYIPYISQELVLYEKEGDEALNLYALTDGGQPDKLLSDIEGIDVDVKYENGVLSFVYTKEEQIERSLYSYVSDPYSASDAKALEEPDYELFKRRAMALLEDFIETEADRKTAEQLCETLAAELKNDFVLTGCFDVYTYWLSAFPSDYVVTLCERMLSASDAVGVTIGTLTITENDTIRLFEYGLTACYEEALDALAREQLREELKEATQTSYNTKYYYYNNGESSLFAENSQVWFARIYDSDGIPLPTWKRIIANRAPVDTVMSIDEVTSAEDVRAKILTHNTTYESYSVYENGDSWPLKLNEDETLSEFYDMGPSEIWVLLNSRGEYFAYQFTLTDGAYIRGEEIISPEDAEDIWGYKVFNDADGNTQAVITKDKYEAIKDRIWVNDYYFYRGGEWIRVAQDAASIRLLENHPETVASLCDPEIHGESTTYSLYVDSSGERTKLADEVTNFWFADETRIAYTADEVLFLWDGAERTHITNDAVFFWTNYPYKTRIYIE